MSLLGPERRASPARAVPGRYTLPLIASRDRSVRSAFLLSTHDTSMRATGVVRTIAGDRLSYAGCKLSVASRKGDDVHDLEGLTGTPRKEDCR